MANPVRGQVALTVEGQSYRMQLSFNALAVLKRQTGLGIQGLIRTFREQGDDVDPDLLIALVWASLQDHHPDVTIEKAASLYPDGGLEEIIEKVQEMFAVAFPKGSAKANPPKAATTKT
jgi:hypothetical protein